MALKGNWIDKVDGVDYVLAKDINAIAHSVIEVEEAIEDIPENGGGTGGGTGGNEGGTTSGVDEAAVRAIINQVVPAWARASTKPTYNKDEVGLGNVDNVKQYSSSNQPDYPVDSVNGKTGAVQLNADDVGARSSSWMPTAAQVGADPSGTAATKVSDHDTYTGAHNDIRLLIKGLSDRLNALANSDDTTLDDLKEIVTYIKANKALIDSITTSKVSVTDIINNLTTNVTNQPLSAAQGVALKNLIDALSTGKLDASALNSAITQALAEAKESGEFKGDPYTLTENDKTLIVAQVIESLGGNPIFGYVDEDNNIIVQGNLADGTYSVKYEIDNEDGTVTTIDIGELVLDNTVYYSITKNLTNCTLSNSATQVAEGESFGAKVTANDGYELSSVSVTMGGSAVSVSGGSISIASVTGDIVITAVAEEVQTEIERTNFFNSSEAPAVAGRIGSDGANRTDAPNSFATNYIPVHNGDIVEISGCTIVGIISGSDSYFMGCYDSNKTKIYAGQPKASGTYCDVVADSTTPFSTVTITNESVKFVRFTCSDTPFSSTPVEVENIVINIKRNGSYL